MARHFSTRWLARSLWGLTLAVSAVLGGLVVLAPLLPAAPEGWGRAVELFARDATVRRTALASALGLLVTACVFFRPPRPQAARPQPRAERPPPIVGA